MKNILLVSMLWISSWVEAQETATDTLQELPREETEISKTLQLERMISKNWELDREDQRGTFKFVDYMPMYVMPFRFTDIPTEQPQSLNPDRPVPQWRDYQHIETKFQLSLKAKIMQDAFGKAMCGLLSHSRLIGRCIMENYLVLSER